jgi:hypothetical protein
LSKPRSRQFDARDIFLANACEHRNSRKMAYYRPDVLTDPSYWADEAIDDE